MTEVLQGLTSATHLETVAAWQAAPGAYLIIGRASTGLPKAGSARALTVSGGVGVFRAASWELEQELGFGVAIVVRLQSIGNQVHLGDVVLRGSRTADRDLRIQLGQLTSEHRIGTQLAQLAQGKTADVTRFLLETINPTDADDRRQSDALLRSYLTHAAHPDGCIELLLSVSDKQLVLQGWGMHLAEPVTVLSVGAGPLTYKAQVCEFDREDVRYPSVGAALVLDAAAIGFLTECDRVFVLAADRLVARQVVDSRVVSGAEGLGQLRHLYPRLTCSAPLREELRNLLLPQYEGQETLSATNKPVRAAIDIAVCAPGVGLYVAGWVFDPAGHISKIEICSGAHSAVLDSGFVWIERDDVVSAFATDPSFPKPSTSYCGFSVSVTLNIDGSQDMYLRFTLTDGGLAFAPVSPSEIRSQGVLDRLLGSVDIHKASGTHVVDRAMAPFVRHAAAPVSPASQTILNIKNNGTKALVVPMFRPSLPRSLVSSLMRDGLHEDEALILLCGPNWTDQGRVRLEDYLSLYGLRAEILVSLETNHAFKSLCDVLVRLRGEKAIVVSHSIAELTSLDRMMLYNELDSHDVVCPTILYEDASIKFGGSVKAECLRRAPFVKVTAAFAGLTPSDRIVGAHIGMTGGSLSCCALRTDALTILGDDWPHLTWAAGEVAFFNRAERSGLRMKWQPAIHVVSPDEPDDDAEIRILIDGWMLREELKADRCAF